MKKRFTKNYLVNRTYPFASAILLGITMPSLGFAIAKNGTNVLFTMNQESITGTVISSDGPVIGATVSVKENPSVATSTDANGKFVLQAEQGQTLVVNAIGYAKSEFKIDGSAIDITLQADQESLEEVVVVAFGTQKKVNLTGSVASISPKELAERPVSSLQNALQGISPGITVLSRPKEVAKGNDATITIRGRSNLGSPGPMYIIDGIPASAAEFTAISPNDISSMSVLKDAASASLYGSRAANGVILVTTKRGGGDRAVVGFSANYGWQRSTFLPKFANSLEYIELYNRAMANAGKQTTFTDDIIEKYRTNAYPDLYPNTDWYKEILDQGAPQREASLSINAPGKITNYYLGLNYFDQNSFVPGRKQDRISMKFNTNTDVIEGLLKVGTNVSFLKQDYDRAGLGISWVEMGRALPMTVLRQSNGQWGTISNGISNATIANTNQMRAVTEGGEGWNRDNYLQLAGNASLTPFEGFSLDGLVSLKYTNTNSWDFVKRQDAILDFLTGDPLSSTAVPVNEMKEYWGKRQELLLQGVANYERTFGGHYGKLTAGVSQESNVYREAFLGRKNFVNNDLETIVNGSSAQSDMSSDDDGLANRTIQDEWSIRSFFGRFNYNYLEKYLFEANYRIDYSSRFSPEHRRAVFPSLSAGWAIDKESFMDGVSWIDALKLRGSWGVLGNQDAVVIGNYYDLISISSLYSFAGVPVDGAQQTSAVNKAALWEKVYQSNVGVDATLFHGKVGLTADYYVKNTRGILLRPNFLATSGWELEKMAYFNQGETTNRGVEVTATYNGTVGEEFKYSVSANISKINNTINSLGTGRTEMVDGLYINRVGGSVGDYFGYKSDGLFTTQEEVDNHPSQNAIAGNSKVGDIKYVDVNGDGVLSAEDRTILGNDVPWLNYGFNLSASYKGFDINVLTYGVGGVKTYFQQEAVQPFFNGGNIKSTWLDGWTEENNVADAPFPRITTTSDAAQNYITSDFWLFSGNYFRIRGITLGYTFGKDLIKKAKISNLRVYASSNNPFTIMADKRLADYDPETGSGRASYPGIKTFSIGVNASF
ncbi:TonB-dependent receptor [Sphingobacterium shayense]|uniref:SusC/RagA family TonB-linked outer membrane protein n=1 Tax=Sphingobacterium shayense TaxID=626343 RepID=UPI0015564530|nr:TonB-dependent receptor [Sphingobacterium shayense]NQD69301.1 TonB-dependent receptor [Sphingobacterium shayense]